MLVVATNAALAFSTARCLQADDRPFHLLGRGRYLPAGSSRWCLGSGRFDAAGLADETVALQVRAMLREKHLACAIPAGIEATLYLAQHQHLFAPDELFPLASRELLDTLNDKWRFHQLLTSLGVRRPETFLVEHQDDLGMISAPPPYVVKPLSAEASQGVTIEPTLEALALRVADAASMGRLPLLVQEYIPGIEDGASALADHGTVLGCRVHRGQPGQSLVFLEDEAIIDVVERLVEATGFHGVLDLDFRRDARDGSVWTIECNPRLFFTVHMAAATGMNHVARGVALAAGHPGDADRSLVGTTVLNASDCLRAKLRRTPMSDASRNVLRAERADPLASVLRMVENVLLDRAPRLAARLIDEPAPVWSGTWNSR